MFVPGFDKLLPGCMDPEPLMYFVSAIQFDGPHNTGFIWLFHGLSRVCGEGVDAMRTSMFIIVRGLWRGMRLAHP
jgi:hypothetical protein